MYDEPIYNQTIEQLRQLRTSLTSLSLLQSIATKYAQQLILLQKQSKSHIISIQETQFILTIKLMHSILSSPTFHAHQQPLFQLQYQLILLISDWLKDDQQFDVKIWHYKVIVALLDLKIGIIYDFEPKYSFEELFCDMQETYTVQNLLASNFRCLRYYLLALLIQLLKMQEIQGYLEFYALMLTYIKTELQPKQQKLTEQSISHPPTNQSFKNNNIRSEPNKRHRLSPASKNIIPKKYSEYEVTDQLKLPTKKGSFNDKEAIEIKEIQEVASIKDDNAIKEDRQELITILLHIYLAFKLMQKHHNHLSQPKVELNIYSLFYELDYNLTEECSIKYKKCYSKKTKEATAYVLLQFKSLINNAKLDQEITQLELYKEKAINHENFRVKTLTSSNNLIFNKSKSCFQRTKSLTAIKKIKDNQLGNNMFVPKHTNYNLQLKNRIQFKHVSKERKAQQQKKQSGVRNKYKRISINNNIESQTKNLKKENKKPRSSRFSSLNTPVTSSQQGFSLEKRLQSLLCRRPNNALNINLLQEQRTIDKNQHDRSSKRGKRVFFPPSISNKQSSKLMIQKNSVSYINEVFGFMKPIFANNIPQSSIHLLERCFKTLLALSNYEQLQTQMPYYGQLLNLQLGVGYWLKGCIIQFLSIKHDKFRFELQYKLNNKLILKREINLLQEVDQEYFQERIIPYSPINQYSRYNRFSPSTKNLYLFNFFGKLIYLFQIKIIQKPSAANQYSYKQIEIKDQKQHYSYTVYLTSLKSRLIIRETIIQTIQTIINKINRSIEIHYDYNKAYELTVDTIQINRGQVKLHELFREKLDKYTDSSSTIYICKHSLKMSRCFVIFTVRLRKAIGEERYFLIMHNQEGKDFKNKRYRFVIICAKIQVQKQLISIRNEQQLRNMFVRGGKMMMENWNSVFLNRNIIRPHSKKYFFKKNNCFIIFQVSYLIEKNFIVISGRHNFKKWYLIMQLEQMKIRSRTRKNKSIFRQNLEEKRLTIKYGNKTTIIMKNATSKKLIKANTILQTMIVKELRECKIEKDRISLCGDWFRMMHYDYNWYQYANKRLSYCYKSKDKINVQHVIDNKFLLFDSFRIKAHTKRAQVYQEFKRQQKEKAEAISFIFYQCNLFIKIASQGQKIVCNFTYEDEAYQIDISLKQLFNYDFPWVLKDKMIRKPLVKERISKILLLKVKQKLLMDE